MTKKNAATRLRQIGVGVGEILARVDAESQRFSRYVGEQYVALGILFDEGAEIHSAFDLGDWREWARSALNRAAPNVGISVDTLYRIRNAGAVARVCEGADFSEVTYLALVPFYRVLAGKLAAAKSDEEREQARVYVRALVTKGLEHPEGLTVAAAEQLTEAYAPTRGKGAKDAKATAANRKAAKSRKAAKTATAPVVSAEDSASRESCGKAIARILAKYDAESIAGVKLAMLATAKLCESHNPSTVAAMIRGHQS